MSHKKNVFIMENITVIIIIVRQTVISGTSGSQAKKNISHVEVSIKKMIKYKPLI